MIGACQMADNALPKTLTVTQALHAGRCATLRGSAPRPLLRRAQKAQIKPRLYPLLDQRRGSGHSQDGTHLDECSEFLVSCHRIPRTKPLDKIQACELKVPPQRGSLFENLGEFGPKGPELSLSTKSKKRSGFSVSAMAMLGMFVPHTLALGREP